MKTEDIELNKDCKECFGVGTTFIYFVDYKRKIVVEEWIYCETCYPDSSCFSFDSCTHYLEEISTEEARRLIDEENYRKHVP